MNINIKTNALEISQSVKDHLYKRLEKIEKILGGDPVAQCDVELAKMSPHYSNGEIFKAEIHLVATGKNCYASVEKSDLYSAIDIVRDDILRELKGSKEKKISMMRRSGAVVKNMAKGLWPFGKKFKIR